MRVWLVLIAAACTLAATADDYRSARQKIDRIESGQLPPGTRVRLTAAELDAWAAHEVAESAPDGVRDPHLQPGDGTLTGSAVIDFAQVRKAQGHPPGWLARRLLEGEHPVRVTVRVRSSAGRAEITVEQVEISGIVLDGATLDFLIRNLLLPNFPDAAIGRPFDLSSGIDHVELTPDGATVVMGSAAAVRL